MNVSKFFRVAIAASALMVGFASAAKADIVTWTGTTTGAATVDLSPLGAEATAVPYHALQFTVDTDGEYTFQLTGQWDIDSVSVLYENAFDPNDVLANGIVASDDNVSLNTTAFASDLFAGTTYVFLVAGYTDTDFGQYSVTIGGPGVITAVPEPSTYLMLGLGLAAVGFAARRKAQR